jgi:3-oxoacyl-[acyl-carrier protein] reductase
MTEGKRFAGRRVVVTGGASGIGFATVERLVAEGAKVVIWDISQTAIDSAIVQLGEAVSGQSVDVADAGSVEAATQATLHDGVIDALVCSAGITGPNEFVTDYPVDAWRRVIDINLNGVFHCNKYVAAHMASRGYGRIVNIASVAGKEGNPKASAYSTSKAAVIGLTKSLGKELATSGVTVNAITPAAVETPIFAQMTEEHIAYMRSKIPMNRFGLVAEVASLIVWVASEECSFTTGAVFDISGGRATY